MKDKKGETTRRFNRAAQGISAPKKTAISVPKMIREDQPKPRIKPPRIGASVDAQNFNQHWNEQQRFHRQTPFETKTSMRDKSIVETFNLASDPLDQITSKKRDRGLER